MNIGDLVEYITWKAIITNKVKKGRSGRARWVYTLHFLGDPPEFIRRGHDGYFSGFQGWELELLSTGEPNEDWRLGKL